MSNRIDLNDLQRQHVAADLDDRDLKYLEEPKPRQGEDSGYRPLRYRGVIIG